MSEPVLSQPDGRSHATRPYRLFGGKAIVLAFVAAAWFCVAANHYTVFDDEAFSCRLYAMPMGQMLHAQWSGADPDPPVYYILENLWVHAFGVGPTGLRGLSILCALGALFTIRGAARAWFGEPAGFVAMLIAAVHPAHLFFGFAARWYAMFLLMSTALLWVTGRMYRRGTVTPRDAALWGVLAALSALTNYFGLIVAGILGLVLLWRFVRACAERRRLVFAFALAVLLFATWIKPFVAHLATFRDSSPSGSMVATLARTLVALAAGNLASVAAWWVWTPMGIAAALGLVLLIRRWRMLGSIAFVLIGSIVVGVLSRTILDKYVLTISGVACVLLAGLFTTDVGPSAKWRRVQQLAPLFLAVAWIGCYVNLETENHWSSLRWLDPIEATLDHAVHEDADRGAPIVATHPSARYYGAIRAMQNSAIGITKESVVPASGWLGAYRAQDDAKKPPILVTTPTAFMARAHRGEAPATLFTLQTSGFRSLPDWESLLAYLRSGYKQVDEWRSLEDADAALKDQLDPSIHHARWRVTLTKWQRDATTH